MFGNIFNNRIKKLLTDGLIGKFLAKAELQENEDQSVLMMWQEGTGKDQKVILIVAAVKIVDGQIRVVRVIESLDATEAL